MELSEQWINTVYNITEKKNKLEILLNIHQLKELEVDTELVSNLANLSKNCNNYSQFVEKANAFLVDSYSKKKKTY